MISFCIKVIFYNQTLTGFRLNVCLYIVPDIKENVSVSYDEFFSRKFDAIFQ